MKRFITVLLPAVAVLSLALLAGSCSKDTVVNTVSFRDTGCGRASDDLKAAYRTKAEGDAASMLYLEYSAEGLVVTHTDAVLNCSIKNGGIACDVSLEGNVLKIRTYERDGQLLKCLCPVNRMEMVISGLRKGSDYVLEYTCGSTTYVPIDFRYDKGLDKAIDLDLYSY